MLKIFDNYYLDASSVCYMLKKAHVKGCLLYTSDAADE